MKKLFIVRHGDYTDDGEYLNEPLSSLGKKQADSLADKLEGHVDKASVVILSSTSLRATQFAEIISARLDLPFESSDLLWSGTGGKVFGISDDFKKVLELLDKRPEDPDVVILVTHYEYVGGFTRFFGRVKLDVRLLGEVIPKGTAWLIDCEKKELSYIS
ncbi:MAG: phosphoglycerate mutase family protein [Candidatus Staskawiczbacteria bacterium]|nr:phosphoglycerate mutase family protein [Candidatus Staskawiczbacteria bacterium]